MEWLQNNWLWIALGVGFVAMHMFGHGGHGGHGREGGDDARNPKPPNDVTTAPSADQTGANGAVPRAANPTNPALGGMPGRSNHAAAPTDEKRHRHGYRTDAVKT